MHTHTLLSVSLLLLAGCASVRPDPGKYLTPTDHGTFNFDEPSYNKALAESKRNDWRCVLADSGTTLFALAIGLSEANPIGPIVVPIVLLNHLAVAKQTEAGNNVPQRVENAVHCGAAALNIVTIAGAL